MLTEENMMLFIVAWCGMIWYNVGRHYTCAAPGRPEGADSLLARVHPPGGAMFSEHGIMSGDIIPRRARATGGSGFLSGACATPGGAMFEGSGMERRRNLCAHRGTPPGRFRAD